MTLRTLALYWYRLWVFMIIHIFYFSGDKLSILIGRSTGRLSKYINQGSIDNPIWEPIDDAFLGIIDNYKTRNTVVSLADMDGDGKEDMIRYDDSGILKIYADYNNKADLNENLMLNQQHRGRRRNKFPCNPQNPLQEPLRQLSLLYRA